MHFEWNYVIWIIFYMDLWKFNNYAVTEQTMYIVFVIFINKQLDAQFFFMYVYLYFLHVSGNHVPIIRRINCISTKSAIRHSI